MTFLQRLKAHDRKQKQVIVSTSGELRAKLAGKTLAEICDILNIEDEPVFGHHGSANIPNFAMKSKDGVEYFFNVSGSLAEEFETATFTASIFDLVCRSYQYERDVLKQDGTPELNTDGTKK